MSGWIFSLCVLAGTLAGALLMQCVFKLMAWVLGGEIYFSAPASWKKTKVGRIKLKLYQAILIVPIEFDDKS
jgi:hypothetical protein